jgi:hypothetical protein
MSKTQKLYCYVDETGQDAGSQFFIVAAVVSDYEQELIRSILVDIEKITKLGLKKWHSSRTPEKENFLMNILEEKKLNLSIYYQTYKKPLPFLFPMLETIEHAIKDKARTTDYQAIVYVDGIDKKKAKEMTDALRIKGIRLKYVRSARDESEPMIRLADRWAGCIRDALEGKDISTKLFAKAKKEKHLNKI